MLVVFDVHHFFLLRESFWFLLKKWLVWVPEIGHGSGLLIWLIPHVDSAHPRAVWHPGLFSFFICLLTVSVVHAGLLIITKIWITPRMVLRYIGLWFLVQENAITLRQLAAAFGFVASDTFSFGTEAGVWGATCMCRSWELYWLYVHQQWLWSTALNGPFGLKWFVQVSWWLLRGLQLLAAVVSHCGTYIRITLQNIYKSLCMCNVNVAFEISMRGQQLSHRRRPRGFNIHQSGIWIIMDNWNQKVAYGVTLVSNVT